MNGFLRYIKGTFRLINVVLIFSMVVAPVLGSSAWSAPSPTAEKASLSAQEKEDLVRRGVDHYKQGEIEQAQKNLEQARTDFPENYAAPYYLGLIYLKKGERSAAIAQWRQYVSMDPGSENALRIRKNLTVLLREEARDAAQMAVANEASLIRMPADENTVAISAFKNLGSENIKPLGKGMAALLIHDLSLVPGLSVVERVQLQALLEEMNLGTSGLVTRETSPKIGKLLKAKHVTSGSLADLEIENLQIASALVDADQKAAVNTQEAKGELKKFYDLEKQIACQIVEDLGKDCAKAPPAFHKIHTKSLAALLFFAAGLDYLDRERYGEARDSFQKALEEDPSFEMAEQALLDTPVPEMQYKAQKGGKAIAGTHGEMIAMAAANGVPITAAGTAVARDTRTPATGGVGIAPVVGIVAGAAAVAGVAVAAGDSDDGGGGPGTGGTTGPTDVTNATEDDFAGSFNVTDQARTPDQWNAQITFNNGGTGTYIESISGQQNSGTLTWSFDTTTNVLSFRTDGGAQFSGTASGVVNNFTLTGNFAGGEPGTINFVRQT